MLTVTLSITYKPFMLCVIMLNVIMLSVMALTLLRPILNKCCARLRTLDLGGDEASVLPLSNIRLGCKWVPATNTLAYYSKNFKTSFTKNQACVFKVKAGNTKGGSITVPLTSCLTGVESAV